MEVANLTGRMRVSVISSISNASEGRGTLKAPPPNLIEEEEEVLDEGSCTTFCQYFRASGSSALSLFVVILSAGAIIVDTVI